MGLLAAIAACASAAAGAEPGQSATAEQIYANALPRLLQIRTLVAGAGQQTSIGSGFLVSSDGLAITNYHVVSQAALEPRTYRLEYVGADGSRGGVSLLDVDLLNDLAIVRIDRRETPFFESERPMKLASMPKGERLYSMGNPLDLGFTIIEGSYNGLIDHSYTERFHFSGALNPGMSGGPTVTAEGRVIGINVATRRGGQLVSFLVPAVYAGMLQTEILIRDELVKRGGKLDPVPDLRADIARQLVASQTQLYKSILDEGFRSVTLGPYRAPEPAVSWLNCWASTNAADSPKPRASINTTTCESESELFIVPDFDVGNIHVSHSFVKSVDLNQFQFAILLTQLSHKQRTGGQPYLKWLGPERCHEDFVATATAAEHPSLRVTWCARAYRKFEGIYDVALVSVTQDNGSEALVSSLYLQAIAYDDAIALGKRFLEEVQVMR